MPFDELLLFKVGLIAECDLEESTGQAAGGTSECGVQAERRREAAGRFEKESEIIGEVSDI